ncbi:DUF4403 family protein [Sphingobium baderi]|uniref:DUF4403 family protein n=1 Tax=Sphingobium baderi TaxID=1332080 RepID=UPI0006854F79|nr:DUF4403 family protein [Sphingobium baderi]
MARSRQGKPPPFPVPRLALLLLCLAGLGSGCSRPQQAQAPPRAHDPVPVPRESSILSVPVDVDTSAIRDAVEQAIPRQLWTINRHSPRCIPPQRVKILGAKLNVTPAISCTIVGVVTRGPVHLRGEGQDIVADIPIHAQISARDVGGILKGETATGSALARARIRLDIGKDWKPHGTVRLHYDWTQAPGIDFLGQRITFTDEADRKLRPVVRNLERDLPRTLSRANLPAQVERLWRQSFTSVQLNERNPPVWMRVTPLRILYNGYAMRESRLRFNLGIEAVTETYVGNRPRPVEPTALPPPASAKADGQFHFFIPVTADYAELEPVIMRALTKRSHRPFRLPTVGPVVARFDKVEAYGTNGGRIAVGLTLAARPEARGKADEVHGRIWITAVPRNAPNSPKVHFDALAVAGNTDALSGDLLLALGNSPAVSTLIAQSLTQNFSNDIAELLGKIRRAIDEKRMGDFLITTDLEQVEIGQIKAFGQGLHLPVRARGTARIAYKPS